MSRSLVPTLRRSLHTSRPTFVSYRDPSQQPSWTPTPDVNPLLTTPPKAVPSYRSPSVTFTPAPLPPRPASAPVAEEALEEDPYANWTAPELTPRKDLAALRQAEQERQKKQRHGDVYKELLPGMVIPLAIAFAPYAVSRHVLLRGGGWDEEGVGGSDGG